MFPAFIFNDVKNAVRTDSVLRCNLISKIVPVLPYGFYILLSQASIWVTYSYRRAFFFLHVPTIIRTTSQKKVFGINATSIVAFMQDTPTCCVEICKQLHRRSVCIMHPSLYVKAAIASVSVGSTGPYPASFSFFNSTEEAFFCRLSHHGVLAKWLI